MTRTRSFAIGFVTLALAACGGSSGTEPNGPPGDGRTITASPSLTFGPSSLTVAAGQTVSFVFGSVAHNVFFDAANGAPADIEGSNANVTIMRTLATPGTYHYTCHIHPFMQGTIVVQ